MAARKWGVQPPGSKGFIAEVGAGTHRHLFGGTSWTTFGSSALVGPPVLMLSLDASDPRLAFDFDESLDSVPLVSLLNYEPHLAEQVYEIDARRRSVSLVRTSDESISPLGSDLMLPVPLPEREISLRPMGPAEIPTDEAAFWEACDSFVGGSAFVRVGGAPIWLQEPRDPACDCGAPMRYVAAIGYEAYDRPSGIVAETIPFFVGEMAYYFFLCGPCSRLLVLSDPA